MGQQHEPKFEKFALNYFILEILPKQYNKKHKFKFTKRIEEESTKFGVIKNCFDDQNLPLILDSLASIKPILKNNKHKLLVKKKDSINPFSQNELKVYRSVCVNDLTYVLIVLNFRRSYSDCYFLEINQSYEVTRWCKSSLMY
jgi:hypothetical protein